MQQSLKPLLIVTLLASLLAITACAPAAKTPTVSPDEVLTQAAGTVAVQLTQSAALTPSPLPVTQTPTSTSLPTATEAVPTPPSSVTSTPTTPNLPTQPAVADAATFVADITIPDGTGAAPGIQFVKTWRIKNIGKTTWTAAYTLNWVDGDKMGGPDSIPMPNEVRPGETVDLSIKLTAPATAGSYQTFYRLKNASGQFFKLDTTGDLWIKIAVGGSSPTPDFTLTAKAPTITPSATPTK